MNKYREAFENIKEEFQCYVDLASGTSNFPIENHSGYQSLIVLQQLVDKEEPKKLIETISERINNGGTCYHYLCPSCNIQIFEYKRRCPNCNQVLGWSEE